MPEVSSIDKDSPVRLAVLLQLINFVATLQTTFSLFHGNIKIERIFFDKTGHDGFIHNGNMIILGQQD